MSVLLVEADLRQLRIGDELGLEGSDTRGLVDATADDHLTLPDVVQHPPRFNLSALPAGRSPASPYEARSIRLGSRGSSRKAGGMHYASVVVDKIGRASCRERV